MARIKATSTDIHARLARAECANFRGTGCLGNAPCAVVNGEPCDYFAEYVKPLLDFNDVAAKYGREAKIHVALNPNAKVVRKRRQAAEPRLLDAAPAPAKPERAAKPAPRVAPKPAPPPPAPAKPVVVAPPPAPAPAPKPKPRVAPPMPEQPALLLELVPEAPTGKKRRR